MAYIGNDPFLSSQRQVTDFTATAGQDTFTPAGGYQLGYVDVYQNGILLVNGTDYTASNGTTVVLTEAAAEGDSIKLVTYVPRGLTDGYTKAEADARYEPIDTAYTKAESDARYYTQSEVDNAVNNIDALPAQTGQSGNYLTTDGTTASWAAVESGAGYFLGENGATGDTTNGLGDIFRVHQDSVDTAVTIAANTNAVAAGPLTLNATVTVNGTLTVV